MYKVVGAYDGGTTSPLRTSVDVHCIGNTYRCCIEVFGGILGMAALAAGAVHLNDAEYDCPWNSMLPVFLFISGIVNVCSTLSHFGMANYRGSYSNKLWKCIYCLSLLSIVTRLGLILWGMLCSFFILSETNPIRFFDYRGCFDTF